MVRRLKKIEVREKPELLEVVEQIEASGQPCLLTRDGETIAIIYYSTPVPAPKPVSADSPLWGIVGIASSDGPTDVSSNKHKYLAEAYADLHDEDE